MAADPELTVWAQWEPDAQIDPPPKGDRALGIDHGLGLYLVSGSILGFQKKGGQLKKKKIKGWMKVVGAGLRPSRGRG